MSISQQRFNRKQAKREMRNKLFEISQAEATAKSLESEVMTLLIRNIKHLQMQFIRWKMTANKQFRDRFTHFIYVWVHWLHYDIESFNKKFLGVQINSNENKHLPLRCIQTPEQFWNNFDLYEDIIPLVWRIRFTPDARLKLMKKTPEIIEAVLRKLVNMATGFINITKSNKEIHCTIQRVGPCAYMAFFSSIISENLIMVFCTEINRIPYTSNHNLIYYSLEQHLKVVNFVASASHVTDAINSYIKKISPFSDLYIETEDSNSHYVYYGAEKTMRRVGNLYFPIVPSKVYLTPEEIASMGFNAKLKKWVKRPEYCSAPSIDMFFRSHPIIKQLATEEAGDNFVRFLTSIPNFRIKLTKQQKNAVSSSGNIVILGRSGTGKTTCAVLRMFASELYFKFKELDGNRKFGPEDVGRTTVLHTAFVTASPVLTNEVKRFYNKLKEHVKKELEEKIKRGKDAEKEVESVEKIHENDRFSESESEEDDDSGPTSMNLLTDDDFPLFFTVRRLIFMIDASLRRPFFARDMNGKVIGAGTNFEWHNEYKGSLKISRDYKDHIKKTHKFSDDSESDEEDLDRDLNTELIMKSYEEQRKKKSATRSFEVDFKVFKEKFWPKIKNKIKLSALVIWTEITAYIKGSADSYKYHGFYLPRMSYTNQGRKSSLLDTDQKNVVWDLFIEYERWKVSMRAYDFQDIVNYITSQIKYYGYTGIPLHYMMVDEVQDLTPATIALLTFVSKEKLVFSGDTAQTIAKGVGFKFSDIQSLFKESDLPKPTIYHLTKNFRTHNKVLNMANSVVSLLETLFPQTIDKLPKETSRLSGPMPKIITSQDHAQLFHILFGFQNKAKTEMQFGCNQVVIVRTQESKERIHPLLSHALCLTVFESKGLEFDDVVLYNFFTDSEISNEKWRIVSMMQTTNNYDERGNNQKNRVTKLKCSSVIDQSKLSLLCTELKSLYVAVTRPKRNLIIFDEDPERRRYMQEFWHYMKAVEFSEYDESAYNNNIKAIAEKTSGEAWRAQGERMMAHKFYDQAAKCFTISGHMNLEAKAKAFAKANSASNLIVQVEAALDENFSVKLTKKMKADMMIKQKRSEELFKEAAEDMLVLSKLEESKSLLKQAAQCFASGKDFHKAAVLYEEIGFFGQAAESYASAKEYEKAAVLFDKKGEYVRAIECYSLCEKWDDLIRCLHRYKEYIPAEERKKYVYKYIPVALEAIMPKILPNEQRRFISKIVEEQKNTIEEANENEENEDESD